MNECSKWRNTKLIRGPPPFKITKHLVGRFLIVVKGPPLFQREGLSLSAHIRPEHEEDGIERGLRGLGHLDSGLLLRIHDRQRHGGGADLKLGANSQLKGCRSYFSGWIIEELHTVSFKHVQVPHEADFHR